MLAAFRVALLPPQFILGSNHQAGHPKDHTASYLGWMHADGYAGFEDLYRTGATRAVACMAQVRRKFVDFYRSQGSPMAEEAIGRIVQLYAVEKDARGSPPDRRVELRQANAAPVFDELEVWLAMQLTTTSGKSPLAGAIRYALTSMERLRPYLGRSTMTRPALRLKPDHPIGVGHGHRAQLVQLDVLLAASLINPDHSVNVTSAATLWLTISFAFSKSLSETRLFAAAGSNPWSIQRRTSRFSSSGNGTLRNTVKS